ncbi:MAG: UDP-N-acetylmuramoyl-L-alanyl-D-glutamate--2,6-diaminopimelate ligase [Armatimonadetes bacterium]|nr:UDP-N-acetylmuramoyl-L-alanyl-D-glutamate--2,6-diaminopimelate ligase [Armatimonadota bacterium]
MKPKRLSEIVDGAAVRCSTDWGSDPTVRWVTADSRDVRPDSLFVCMPSARQDTHAFLPAAAEAGAVACVVHSPDAVATAQGLGLAVVGIANEGQAFHFAVGRLCRSAFDDPTLETTVVGVTGTNGKTTTAWMVRNALVDLGAQAAYLGTLGFQTTGAMRPLENTTPFPVETWRLLEEARESGCEAVVLEASSHALYQRRLAGVSFDVGVFTNLTQDHLDFHESMESYAAAKKLLFTEYAAASSKEFAACVNIGDATGASWIPDLACPVFTFGSADAMIRTEGQDVQVDGLTLAVEGGPSKRLKFGGHYNVENATSALAALTALGYEAEEALEALATVSPVPGRFEPVPNGQGIGVLVDYAHTPDALDNLLRSVRELRPRQIVTVFGCGGDRDRTKRPKMAAAASSLSDVTVVTSDNPRTEDPEAIIDEIVPGIKNGARWERVTDRRAAIERAVRIAEPGDVVVIAGKGHEDYQIIGREKVHMSDQEMAAEALKGRSAVEA